MEGKLASGAMPRESIRSEGASDRPLLILGTRSFAPEVADLASEVPPYRVVGFVENMDRERCEEELEGLPVFWIEDVEKLAETHWAVCALGTTHRRGFIERVAAYRTSFATLIHPSARVSTKSSVGEGSILSAGTIVGAHAQLGRHVLANRGVLIGHDVEIGDYVTLGPGANVGGSTHIGEGTYVGIAAIVLDHIRIGSRSVIGAGSLVTKDVGDNVQVAGMPARVVRKNIDGK